MLRLDGSITSSLNWQDAIAAAEKKEGLLCWQIDLGLFSGLKRGLSHTADFQALLLALDHFKTAIWEKFKERTEKVVLFKGSIDLVDQFPWDATQESNYRQSGEEMRLYCLKACAEYLRLLVQKMGDEIPLIIQLDATCLSDPFEKALMLDPELFSRFKVEAIGGEPWGIIGEAALCLPLTKGCQGQVRAIQEPCRLIHESALVYSWEGLERIYYDPAALDSLAMRKLQGFCAAGGAIIPL